MPLTRPLPFASLLLLMSCVACANGSTSGFTQAPILFSEDAGGAPNQANASGGSFVAAQGNAVLPLGSPLTPDQAASTLQGSTASAVPAGAVAGALSSSTIEPIGQGGPVAALNGLAGSLAPSSLPALSLQGATPLAVGGANANAAVAAGVSATGETAALGVSALGAAPLAATAATAPVSLTLRAPVLGTTTVNTSALTAPSVVNSALVTSSLGGQQGLLCVPSLRRKC